MKCREEMRMDYVALRREVMVRGLLERQYGYYALKIVTTLLMLCMAVGLLFWFSSIWLQLLAIVGIAFSLMQVGLLGHDAGHQAIFKSSRWNDCFGHLFMTVLVGLPYRYWVDRHSRHHANPNEDEDPDFAVFALTEEVMRRKKGIPKFMARRQHTLFVPITSYFLFEMFKLGFVYNIRLRNCRAKWVELFMIGFHAALFWAAPFFLFAWWKALIIVLGVPMLWGVYFGSIVATNHKGMKVMEEDEQLDFVEKQVLTTRNVRSGLVVDFVYGGLNYQIEHHLFPTMPRNNFKKCKALVMQFCKENGLPYVETGVFRSYRIILGELRKVAKSRPARASLVA